MTCRKNFEKLTPLSNETIAKLNELGTVVKNGRLTVGINRQVVSGYKTKVSLGPELYAVISVTAPRFSEVPKPHKYRLRLLKRSGTCLEDTELYNYNVFEDEIVERIVDIMSEEYI